MGAKISVIIPVYNVEPYLRKCLDSVLCQTYGNLEVILVDDGSTDSSGHICDEYADMDSRVKVIHQKNAGLSAARNTGLSNAIGEWIAFLDSDDWIEPQMYKTLLDVAVKYDVEIVSCKTRPFKIMEDIVPIDEDSSAAIFYLDEMIMNLTTEKVRFEVWNKLWKRSLIGDIRFITGQVSEDVYFNRKLFLKAKKMVVVNKTLHNYLIQRPGNTNSSFKIARLCVFDEFLEWAKELKEIGEENAAKNIQCIAADFAIAIYESAVATNQSKEIKQTLKKHFKTFYLHAKDAENLSLHNKARMWLFNVSPLLFSCVKKMLSRVKKRSIETEG